jgi:hypothetical protein
MYIYVCDRCVLWGFIRLGHVLVYVLFCAKWDKLYCGSKLGLCCEQYVCYTCLHRNVNHVIYVIIQVLRTCRGITRLGHVLCEVHLCVTVRSVLLWKFGFYCKWYVCNASVERNTNHFIVYLIIYADLCCVRSARWWSVMLWGACDSHILPLDKNSRL